MFYNNWKSSLRLIYLIALICLHLIYFVTFNFHYHVVYFIRLSTNHPAWPTFSRPELASILVRGVYWQSIECSANHHEYARESTSRKRFQRALSSNAHHRLFDHCVLRHNGNLQFTSLISKLEIIEKYARI